MTQLLVLSEHDIAQTFTIADAIDAVEDAYVQKAKGTGVAWPIVYEQFAPGEADMDIRSGELAGSGLFGLKLTAWFGANPERGLPEIFGTVLLCDDRTGEPLALLNGSALTGMRTGAAGALGVAHLARKDASALLVCGAGHQAAFQIAATLILRPALDHVMVWDPRHASAPVARVEQIKAQVAQLLADAGASSNARIEAVADGKAAVNAADAIITVTPATEPFIEADWCPGTHLSCVGADMPGKQEIASDLPPPPAFFCDDRAQSVAGASSKCLYPRRHRARRHRRRTRRGDRRHRVRPHRRRPDHRLRHLGHRGAGPRLRQNRLRPRRRRRPGHHRQPVSPAPPAHPAPRKDPSHGNQGLRRRTVDERMGNQMHL